ncbi:TPA: hypothetical protein GFX68_09680 [Escherichia coli]|nr:hypothetical protein [Escherichia coli]HAH2599511.1 hypothetical protein [Escherichia coli]HAH3376876.1 hypothetical protein [Escherichia coli]HAH3635568.1 hypothetical protein [Escherichia coli]
MNYPMGSLTPFHNALLSNTLWLTSKKPDFLCQRVITSPVFSVGLVTPVWLLAETLSFEKQL